MKLRQAKQGPTPKPVRPWILYIRKELRLNSIVLASTAASVLVFVALLAA